MRSAFILSTLAFAALLLTAPSGTAAMTPALLDPKALAGGWILTGPGAERCTLTLKTEPAADGPGLALEAGDCARIGGLPALGSWQASNDGFGLAAADRRTVLFFSNEGDGLFAARSRDGVRYELTRAP